jgi:hypothetical protein
MLRSVTNEKDVKIACVTCALQNLKVIGTKAVNYFLSCDKIVFCEINTYFTSATSTNFFALSKNRYCESNIYVLNKNKTGVSQVWHHWMIISNVFIFVEKLSSCCLYTTLICVVCEIGSDVFPLTWKNTLQKHFIYMHTFI